MRHSRYLGKRGLLDLPPDWRKHWRGMPAFDQENQTPMQSIAVHLRSPQDREAFSELVGQRITDRTRFVWYPKGERMRLEDSVYVSEKHLNPRYPMYVISKGRWKSQLTSKALERMGVSYRIVVEPQERKKYARAIDSEKILVLPFSNLGRGSIPVRNWVWEHSLKNGDERHWILDDNIRDFQRLTDNTKHRVVCGNVFRAAEDFVDRYENVAISGFHYAMFKCRKWIYPPFNLNTRIYSCILIKNDVPYRWRGRYNEDTDLSLRVLKDGWCTVSFNAFLASKMSTMTMEGGNTEELYRDDGRRKMAESLRKQHPDVVKIRRRWGRWQHMVDYRRFRRNELVLKSDAIVPEGVNDYGMHLEHLDEEE